MIVKSGYRDLAFLIDHETSGLTVPNPNSNLIAAESSTSLPAPRSVGSVEIQDTAGKALPGYTQRRD